ncbi:MAG: hypothetical protein Roseis2KO_04550 [Roseivirga sp.]
MLLLSAVFMVTAPSCKDAPAETDPTVSELPVSSVFSAAQVPTVLEATNIIDEASGLAASRSNPLYLWTHNDSGGNPEMYLFTTTGADSGRYELEGVRNVDWEDMTIGPGPDDALTYLMVGDIGDNAAVRDSYAIYRVPEPDLNVIDLPEMATLTNVETIDFVYSDEVSRDAETLMVDPTTKDIYVISKREAQVGVYRLPYPQELTDTDTAEFQGLIPFTNVVAGDISASGDEILIKDYFRVYYWQVSGTPIYETMTGTPQRLNYAPEPQGEAIALSADGQTYYTLSELDSSEPATLLSYRRN